MNDIAIALITKNESHRLGPLLKSLKGWASEIVVIDSGSTDETVSMLKAAGANVQYHPFDNYGAQKNRALRLCRSPWILSVDADEELTPAFKAEVDLIRKEPGGAVGYWVNRLSFYLDRPIYHGGWYPDWVLRLVQNTPQGPKGRFTEPEVHEELVVMGETKKISAPILHRPFLGIADQAIKNMRYAQQGALAYQKANKIVTLFHVLLKPWGKFLECYLWKRGFLDGFAGLAIAVNAMHSMFVKMALAWSASRGK